MASAPPEAAAGGGEGDRPGPARGSAEPLRLCFAVPYHDEHSPAEPAELLDRFPLLRHLPQELARRGHRVELLHLFPRARELVEGGVPYRFLPAPGPVRAAAQLAGHASGRAPATLEAATPIARRVRASRPDVLHVHGTGLHLNLALLAREASRPGGPALVIHHHGGGLSPRAWVRPLQRRSWRRAARVTFSAREIAGPLVRAGALAPGQVAELMETSSPLGPLVDGTEPMPLSGDPVFVHCGRLHPIKDPWTTLRGFERIAAAWPGAELHLCYLDGELEDELRALVATRPLLAGRVHWLGRIPYDRMAALLASADVLLQASTREYSGLAVLDAMACGVLPVLSDIPSFRAMTGGGRCGVLFPVGDPEALARGVLALGRDGVRARREEVRAHFERELGFGRMAARVEAIDREVLAEAGRPARSGDVAG